MTQADDTDKIIPRSRLAETLGRLRESGQRIVFTNGCFDVLHAGHVRYLQAARALGDFLIVGVNSDASVTRIKGPDRPINPLEERMEILAALASVDLVVPFDSDSVEPLIRETRPDVLAKGGDYDEAGVVGAEYVRSYGGDVFVLRHTPGRSTTETIRRMRGLSS